ncbi:MAG: endonuclease/exonuclease/phosphatase family protein [Pseudomonadota bacterium]
MKLITYNMHKGFGVGNRRLVLHEMRAALREANADIVCLQELQGEHHHHRNRHDLWPDEEQLEFLADSLWPHTAYGKNAVYQHGHHGNAILSRYPFLSWENINVSDRHNASRSLLHGVVEPVPGEPLHIICVHLGLLESERQRQIRLLSDRIESHVPHDEALIIAGDFNDWSHRCDRYLQQNSEVSEAFEQYHGRLPASFPAWLPILKVDRVYTRGLTVHYAEKLTGQPWRQLSDHIPLGVHLSF